MNNRIWIYSLSKQLTNEQLTDFNKRCANFVSTWTAHEVSLDASFELYKNRLLIFSVNEQVYGASGCSIDKQLQFVKKLENEFSIELLNRLLVAYETTASEIEVVKASDIKSLIQANTINKHTLVFNNSITQSSELETQWKQELNKTWLNKYV